MFVTHNVFKHPLQLDPKATVWVAVELGLATPWLIATVGAPDEAVCRDFLMIREDLLLQFTEQPHFGELVGLHIVLPPDWSATQRWSLLPVTQVQRTADTNWVYLTTETGLVYSGFPLALVDQKPDALSTCWVHRSL